MDVSASNTNIPRPLESTPWDLWLDGVEDEATRSSATHFFRAWCNYGGTVNVTEPSEATIRFPAEGAAHVVDELLVVAFEAPAKAASNVRLIIQPTQLKPTSNNEFARIARAGGLWPVSDGIFHLPQAFDGVSADRLVSEVMNTGRAPDVEGLADVGTERVDSVQLPSDWPSPNAHVNGYYVYRADGSPYQLPAQGGQFTSAWNAVLGSNGAMAALRNSRKDLIEIHRRAEFVYVEAGSGCLVGPSAGTAILFGVPRPSGISGATRIYEETPVERRISPESLREVWGPIRKTKK